MRIEIIRIVVANTVALINGGLLVYSMVVKEKSAYMKPLNLSGLLQIVSYLVGGYYSGIIANIFSICRNIYIEKSNKKSPWIITAIVLVGGIISISVNRIVAGSSIWDYIPTISVIGYSWGMLLAKNTTQMKIVNALDISIWIIFDYTHMLVVNVVLDFIIILSAFATQYVRLDPSEEPIV